MGEEWADVSHGSRFPDGAVKAMGRELAGGDHTTRHSYVAVANMTGEPCFGRAWNNDGKVEAWFPWGGKEFSSQNFSSEQRFRILLNGDAKYHWKPVNEVLAATNSWHVVSEGRYCSVVVKDFGREILGKGALNDSTAWTCYGGKEHCHTASTFKNSTWVLVRPR